jgi:RNA polymerase sigma-70 factor (ECF subfamily)
MTNSEERFIREARSGSPASFSRLVEIYQERAVRAAYAFVGNFEDARDLAQEAFVKAYQNLADFREESRFYTWFYRILMNTCKDFLRKKNVRRHLFFWMGPRDGEEGEESDPAADAVSTARTAREEAMDRELGGEIFKQMDRLPHQQRTAFTLRYLEGLSLEETALHMGLTVGAVKATLWQACQKMKKFLGAVWEEEVAL